MLDILKTLETCWETKSCAAIATIIHKQGSTYRRRGATSVILPDGTIVGTLSGGCVEEDIFEHAKHVMETGIGKLVAYDFYGDGDMLWGLGVGCNGSLKIWIEPFDPKQQMENTLKTLEIIRKQLSSATIISSNKPDRYSIGTKFVLGQEEIGLPIPDEEGLFTIHDGDAQVELYIEERKTIPRLIIFGAGPDVVPLVRGAKLLQWLVTVVDHRPSYVNSDRFPEADEIIVAPSGTFPQNLHVSESDYAVIMTHHFQQDSFYLQQMLLHHVSYLGVLGPQKRTKQLLGDRSALFTNSLYSPIGLDIGAETPEEIAISILSEIICHVNEGSGSSLKNRQGRILERRRVDM